MIGNVRKNTANTSWIFSSLDILKYLNNYLRPFNVILIFLNI